MSRMPFVAAFVSVACLVYGASLPLQRVFPAIGPALAWSLAGGVKPTYYLRTGLSLAIGALAGFFARRLAVGERVLAWATAIAMAASVVLIYVFV